MPQPLPICIIFVFVVFSTHAQSSSTVMGARSSGMAYASSCLTDEWSIFNNVAGIAQTKQPVAAFSYDAQTSFKSFDKIAAVFAVPLKIGVAGMGVYRFGDDLYNEQIVSGAFSSTFGLASLGVNINYIQYNTTGFGRKDAVSISAGGIANITPKISVGASMSNINQPTLSDVSGEHLPTQLTLGVLFRPISTLNIATEIKKDLDYEATWKLGLEYTVHERFVFRTGFNLNPNAGFVGFGFKSKKITLDYAYAHFIEMSGRHQATVGYKFKTK